MKEKIIQKGKEYKDHKGNVFGTRKEMCAYYGINVKVYANRIRKGWPLEKALTAPIDEKRAGKKTADHMGKEYPSVHAMCKNYNISPATFSQRIEKGWPLEKALTEKTPDTTSFDHLGNVYRSEKDMCVHYGVNLATFRKRIKNGIPLEEALTADRIKRKKVTGNKKTTDHTGKTFDSIKEMCEHYHVSPSVYSNRIKNGDTMEEALTGLNVYDHLGNAYQTQKEMCEQYGLPYSTFQMRIKNGWTLEQALTADVKELGKWSRKEITDHTGKTYPSVKEMCEHYGITLNQYQYRIRKGWTLEETLTSEEALAKLPVQDHLGNIYHTQSEMCEQYGITSNQYQYRIRNGWTLEQALIGKREKNQIRKDRPLKKALAADSSKKKNGKKVVDHTGKEYPSVHAMCRNYNISPATFGDRMKKGWPLEKALIEKTVDTTSFDHLGNVYRSQKEMCEHYGVNLATFRKRIKNGIPLEEALTADRIKRKKVTRNKKITDHTGKTFGSIKEMCEHYHVSPSVYSNRIKKGDTMEEALTGLNVYDHLGNAYQTQKDMCEQYGLHYTTFQMRIKNGWTLEQALTTDVGELNQKRNNRSYRKDRTYTKNKNVYNVNDHLGNTYQSLSEMCKHYGVKVKIFRERIMRGWTVEQALTGKNNINC